MTFSSNNVLIKLNKYFNTYLIIKKIILWTGSFQVQYDVQNGIGVNWFPTVKMANVIQMKS